MTQVNFYGTCRFITGEKTIEARIRPGGTLLDLLRGVTAAYPRLRNALFDERGNLFPSIPIFINGRNPRLLADGIQTVIQPQDVLSIFSPVASGRLNVEDINHSQSG